MPSIDAAKLRSDLERFYKASKATEDKLFNIFTQASCRLIEHFASKYTQEKLIMVSNVLTQGRQRVSVYDSYKLHLDAYTKRYFDPCARGTKIQYDSPFENRHLITTIGQLNFFKWLICYQIMDKLIEHKEWIKFDMKIHQKPQIKLTSPIPIT